MKRKRRAVDFCMSTRRPAKEIKDGKAFLILQEGCTSGVYEKRESERARVHLKRAFVMGSCSRRRGKTRQNSERELFHECRDVDRSRGDDVSVQDSALQIELDL